MPIMLAYDYRHTAVCQFGCKFSLGLCIRGLRVSRGASLRFLPLLTRSLQVDYLYTRFLPLLTRSLQSNRS